MVNPAWIKILPASLRAKVKNRPNLQKSLTNTVWLFGDKIFRMGLGLLVGVWIARYLGPEQFGLMNYALAIVALVGAAASLGLNGIVVRDLVKEPDRANTILGTAFLLQLIGGVIAYFLAMAAINILRPSDNLVKAMVAILGFSLVFKSADVVKYWFESQVKSKYIVWAQNGAFLVLAVTKVFLVLMQSSVMAFVWTVLAEAVLVSFLLLLIYVKKAGRLTYWRVRYSRGRSLLRESWPLILVSMASMINMRMDQIMLGAMTNDSVVGNYSAAVRLSEVWLVVPSVIGSSIYPSIIAAKESSEALYRSRILKASCYMAWIVLPVALIVSIISNQVTGFLYGNDYVAAGGYLAILIWSGVPYLIFFVFNQMYYIERLVRISFYVAVFAVFSNVSLNLVLIPVFSGEGAAAATLMTAVGSSLMSLFLLNLKTGIFWGRAGEKK